jgi:enolase
MSAIKKIFAREILDSRGNPTVEAEVLLESGVKSSAAVPSGASTGTFEALELRDKDSSRYQGLGVLQAIENVNKKISEALIGMEAGDQKSIDKKMLQLDGTENKTNLGANAILAVSLAVCRTAALEEEIPLYEYIAKAYKLKAKSYKLPTPMFNVINGGLHSDSGLSIQEYMIIPSGISAKGGSASGGKTFREQLRAGSEIFHKLKNIISQAGYSVSVGDEGGFAPKMESNGQPFEFMLRAIEEAGYKNGKEINCGLDAAATSFYKKEEDQYFFRPENRGLTRETLANIYNEWIDKYNIISIEDGLNEEDWDGWAAMNTKLGKKVILIGDDLVATNVKRLKTAIEKKACNAVLIKVNQIGTLSETVDCVKMAKKNKMKIVISHRSGETADHFISDLAVAVGADYIKAGAPNRGERICKYNRLLRIEEKL